MYSVSVYITIKKTSPGKRGDRYEVQKIIKKGGYIIMKKGRVKRVVAIMLCTVLVVGTVAGCSCSSSGTTSNSTTTTASTGYKCDFTNKDIAIPKGTKLTDNGLELTKDADVLVKNVLDTQGQLPTLISRDGEEDPAVKYMQEVNARLLKWKNYNAVADYTADTAKQIDPTLGEVVGFGSNVFDVVRAYYTGDIGAGIEGVSGVLNLFGIFGGGGGVTNEQILMEVQKVYSAVQQVALDVKDIQSLLSVMTGQLDETTMQAYRNGLQSFDNALGVLNTDADILNNMFITGAEILQQQGINAPAENATDAERQEYIGKLISTIEEQQNTNPDLKNFDGIMSDLINNYNLVATELGKTKDFSPMTAFDSYWNTYFNWESQGYSLRVAYRANAEFQVKRAYAMIAMYYNIGTGNTAVTYQQYGQLLANALDSIEQNGPGISPQQVASSHEYREYNTEQYENWPHTYPWVLIHIDGGLYTSTFDKRLDAIWMYNPQENSDDAKEAFKKMPTELMAKYVDKLHGRTLEDDLKLAGVYHDGMGGKGLVSNFKKDGVNGYINFITPDGKFDENYQIQAKGVNKEGLGNAGKDEDEDEWYSFTYQFMLHLN